MHYYDKIMLTSITNSEFKVRIEGVDFRFSIRDFKLAAAKALAACFILKNKMPLTSKELSVITKKIEFTDLRSYVIDVVKGVGLHESFLSDLDTFLDIDINLLSEDYVRESLNRYKNETHLPSTNVIEEPIPTKKELDTLKRQIKRLRLKSNEIQRIIRADEKKLNRIKVLTAQLEQAWEFHTDGFMAHMDEMRKHVMILGSIVNNRIV